MMITRRGRWRQATTTSAGPPHGWRPHQLCKQNSILFIVQLTDSFSPVLPRTLNARGDRNQSTKANLDKKSSVYTYDRIRFVNVHQQCIAHNVQVITINNPI